MSTKHTPGPWRIVDDSEMKNRGPAICGVEKAFTTISIHAHPTGKPCPTVEILDETGEANARLIAAAPELLEALNEIAELETKTRICFDPDDAESLWDLLQQALQTARAAIAKAEGNEPETDEHGLTEGDYYTGITREG